MLNHACLLDQSVHEHIVQDHKPIVLVVEDVVYIVGSLFCYLLVFWPFWLKAYNVVTSCEHAHQRRHHPHDGVLNVGYDYLGTPFLFVAKGFPVEVLHRFFALISDLGV